MRQPANAIAGYLISAGIICPDCADEISTSDDAPDYLEPALAVFYTQHDRCCRCAVTLPNTYHYTAAALAHITVSSAPRQRAALLNEAQANHDPATGLYPMGDLVVNVRTRRVTMSNEPNPPAAAASLPDYHLSAAASLQLDHIAAGNAAHGQQIIRRMISVLENSAGMLRYHAHGLVANKRTHLITTDTEPI